MNNMIELNTFEVQEVNGGNILVAAFAIYAVGFAIGYVMN